MGQDYEGMAYIRDRYGVPAKRGMRVQAYLPPRCGYGWQLATDSRITSAGGGYLFLNGGGPYHPTYNLVYIDKDGTVLCDTRETGSQRVQRLIMLGHLLVVEVHVCTTTSMWYVQVRVEGRIYGALGDTIDRTLTRIYDSLPTRIRHICDTREAEEVKRAKRLADKVWRSNDGRETHVSELSNIQLGAALYMLERKRALFWWKREPPIPRSEEEQMLIKEFRRRKEELVI